MIGPVIDVKKEILSFSEESNPHFTGWPMDINEAAIKWGNVVEVCAAEVVPQSDTAPSAKMAFIEIFKQMSNSSQNGRIIFAEAMDKYAEVLALGMLTYNYQGIPPPLKFYPNMLGLVTGSIEVEAQRLATEMVEWFKTGTAIKITTGETVNWE